MVTIRELITQRRGEIRTVEIALSKREESIAEQERRLSSQEEEFLISTRPEAVTLGRQAALSRIVGIAGVPGAVKEIRRQKRLARRKVAPTIAAAREEISEAKQQVVSEREKLLPVKTEIRKVEQFEAGRRKAISGDPFAVFGLESTEERKGFRAGVEAVKASRQRIALATVGKPIFADGQLTGFEIEGKTVPLQELDIAKLEGLQEAGILTFTRPPPQVGFTPIPPTERERSTVGEFLRSREFIGIGFGAFPPIGLGVTTPTITITETQQFLRERAGLPGRVVAEILEPIATPGRALVTGALIGAFPFLPLFARVGVGTGIAALEFPKVFDPSLPVEQRIAGGIFGGLGIAGVVTETLPFVRGIRARISPGFRATEISPRGFREIPKVGEVGDIGLIEPRKGPGVIVDLPPTSPLVRGGFGRRPGGEELFIGTEQLLATSQRGFFRPGQEIQLQKEFFVTPQEPTLGIAETRVSRLGLVDFFRRPRAVEIGFGLPPEPQIGITIGEVARTEARGAFAIGRGTELEAIRTTGVIRDVARIGRTVISGQGVDIFQFRIGPGIGRPTRPSRIDLTTRPTARISGEILLSAALAPTGRLTPTTIPLGVTTLGVSSIRTGTTLLPSISPPTTTFPTTGLISPPVSPGISPPILPPVSPPTTISPPVPIIEPPPGRARRRRRARGGVAAFDTFVKSKGKFVRTNKKPQRLENALSLGAELVDQSTSRQFKVKRSGRIRKPKRIDPYFEANRFKFREFKQTAKQRKRTPFNFIERTAFAIDTPNEVAGIPLKGVLEQRRRRASGIKIKRKKRKTPKRRSPGSGLTDL